MKARLRARDLAHAIVGCALAALVACRAPDQSAERDAPLPASSASIARKAASPELLSHLALLATQRSLDPKELADAAGRIERGEGTLEGFVDERLHERGFAGTVAPQMLLSLAPVKSYDYVLKSVRKGEGKRVYYLREPCSAEHAIAVKPWWAMATEVLVCPDAYRPDRLVQKETGWYCGAKKLKPQYSDYCGCGPDLIHCFRDEDQLNGMGRALRREPIRTVAYIVDHDRPVDEVFTANETVREFKAELTYVKWRRLNGEEVPYPDPADWPEKGKLAPRAEAKAGMHAGILTTPELLLGADATRALMRTYYDVLWCKPQTSSGVSAEKIWSLGVTDLRMGDGWKHLAAMPVCTECHARLDYGMQFFEGFPGTHASPFYVTALQHEGGGPLYADDIGDVRGTADLSPQGFARLAVAQKEFGACMVHDVAQQVFNGRPSPEETAAMAAEFKRTRNLRSIMRVALLRHAADWIAGAVDTAPSTLPWPATRASSGSSEIEPSPELASALEKSCGTCHDEGPHAFTGLTAYPRSLTQNMLRAVAFGSMPKGVSMAGDARRALVQALIAALFDDQETRDEAADYFDPGRRAWPVLTGSAILEAVKGRAGAVDGDALHGSLEELHPRISELTPTTAIGIAAAAREACRPGSRDEAAFEGCLDRSTSLEGIAVPPGHR